MIHQGKKLLHIQSFFFTNKIFTIKNIKCRFFSLIFKTFKHTHLELNDPLLAET